MIPPTSSFILLNPNMRISAFDDASDIPKVLCEIPSTNGQTNRITIPENIFILLQGLDKNSQLQDIKKHYLESKFKSVSWSKFETFIQEYCLPNKILVNSTETSFLAKPIEQHQVMQIQIPFLKPWLTNTIAKPLVPLYQRWMIALTSIVFITLQAIFYVQYEPYVTFSFDGISAKDGLLTITLLILGLFVHEFGHVTAAYKHGCRDVSVGVGWYLYFLVFYAELSESWRLSRKKRVLIDAGGLYFQAIYMSILVIIYTQTTSAAIFYSLLFLSISFIWNLNPFLRLDGYWIASDMLGISNLRAEATNELKYLAAKLIGRHRARNTPLSNRSRQYLGAYSVLSNLFFVWLSVILSERILYIVTVYLPQKLALLFGEGIQEMSLSDVLLSALVLIFQLFILFFISRFVIRTFISLTAWILPEMKKVLHNYNAKRKTLD